MPGEDTSLFAIQLTSPCIRQFWNSCAHFQDAAKEEFKFRFSEILFAVCSHFLVKCLRAVSVRERPPGMLLPPPVQTNPASEHKEAELRNKHNTNRGANTKKKPNYHSLCSTENLRKWPSCEDLIKESAAKKYKRSQRSVRFLNKFFFF